MSVIVLNKDNFKEEILDYKELVLVDFYADWCGPCKMMSPILDELSEEENIKVCKIDTDEEIELAKEYGVMTIPCIIAFKEGKEINRSIGLVSKDELLKLRRKARLNGDHRTANLLTNYIRLAKEREPRRYKREKQELRMNELEEGYEKIKR